MSKASIPKKAIEKPHATLFELQQLVSDLAAINRNHYRLGTDLREDDIEHSFSVAMLCWYIVSTQDVKLDLSLILKYALAHDFVERYAGDTNTFASAEERLKKIQREQTALGELSQEFAAFPDLIQIMQDYEAKSDPEALFVWTVDKMQALILGDLDNWRPYQEMNINFRSFAHKYEEILDGASPYCKGIFQVLIKYCESTYYDKPTSSQQR